MKHQTVQTGGTGWPSGNILDFHAGLSEVWGSNPGGEKEICLCTFTVVILQPFNLNAQCHKD